ncbi:MAG: hypothetical protein K0U86_13025 [Planctomycetes bacterium]|nr:hypothetical protein [Planctomycetota bacterium]MCH9725812.1 hypothetical protein [Planctomycetota bacterium]MCH9776325.1 hypothetical protein [Planctomycetota bacterium]MCH9792394.1 hypothetical protein [Planctomycetota bacterium]
MQNLIIDTPLGEVNFFVFGVTPAVSIHLDSVPLLPALPPGMSVQGCLGILLRVHCHETVEDLIFECRLQERKYSDHSFESGEHLIAHSWENEHSILMIGTEDEECLNARLPAQQQVYPDAVTSSVKGVSISLPELTKGSESSFHFITAWNNLPTPEEIACWFAVDYKHAELVRQVQGASK